MNQNQNQNKLNTDRNFVIRKFIDNSKKTDLKSFSILSYNTQTLKTEAKLLTLEEELEGVEWDVIGLAEVLCGGANATWVSAAGVVRPPNAFPSGSTKDGDTLYICRASYGNTLAVGQVASDNNCYILLDDGKELISKDNYEVLVY
uniref:Uncharacterized protein n=1 Tax=Cacopsylla melanoneura TaxID=428564 RepID=A0A8D8WZG5_9HEMI